MRESDPHWRDKVSAIARRVKWALSSSTRCHILNLEEFSTVFQCLQEEEKNSRPGGGFRNISSAV